MFFGPYVMEDSRIRLLGTVWSGNDETVPFPIVENLRPSFDIRNFVDLIDLGWNLELVDKIWDFLGILG